MSVKLTQPLAQSNKTYKNLVLFCYSIPNFVAPTNLEKITAANLRLA